jgi:hypothetical protein
MDITRCIPIAAALALAAIASAAEPAVTPATAPAPAAAPATMAPYEGEPMELNAEQRQEAAFRAVQLGMERKRSDKVEDENLIVCVKEKPVGSNVTVVRCTTNYMWRKIRSASLSSGLGGGSMTAGGTGSYGAGGGGSARKDDKVITMSMGDYYKLEKKYGKVPKADDRKP